METSSFLLPPFRSIHPSIHLSLSPPLPALNAAIAHLPLEALRLRERVVVGLRHPPREEAGEGHHLLVVVVAIRSLDGGVGGGAGW
jgi:hypothetical protein